MWILPLFLVHIAQYLSSVLLFTKCQFRISAKISFIFIAFNNLHLNRIFEIRSHFLKNRQFFFLLSFTVSLFLNGDDSLLDVTLTPMSVPSSYGVRKTFDSPSCKRVPPSPFVPKGGFIHQVYMSEEDFNVFTQNGNIFFHEGKPHYQQKLRK